MGQTDFPRFNAQKGRTSIWCRQFSDTGEKTLLAIIGTLQRFGYDALALKVADGAAWQGQIDPLTPIRSIENVRAVRDQLAAKGIAFIPVVVPRGPEATHSAGQAEMHAAIARACGVLVTDLEPYQGFWATEQDGIVDYCAALRAGAGDAYLINQPDPRPSGWNDARVIETARYYDALMPQHYVGWQAGGVNWTDVDAEVARFDSVRALGIDTYATLYGVDRTDLALQFWDRINDRCQGFNVFCFGAMNAAQLESFGNLAISVGPDPIPGTEPPVPPGPVVTLEGVQLGLVRKILDQDWTALAVDANKLAGVK